MFSDFVVVVVGKKLRDQKSAAAAAASEMEMDWDKFLEEIKVCTWNEFILLLRGKGEEKRTEKRFAEDGERIVLVIRVILEAFEGGRSWRRRRDRRWENKIEIFFAQLNLTFYSVLAFHFIPDFSKSGESFSRAERSFFQCQQPNASNG
ncbi:hypothetical protein Fcan01_05535 [Folsomia candida]|uniref:Uncharacterized protein n=1 Tax=Folsomia candida TaxID=158441 RepID=A0A226ESD8_FOLCA|nr:hypothetical protein Fcan01_05535 [Folsomia candida]